MEIPSFEIENNGPGSKLDVLLDQTKTKIIVFKLFQNAKNQIELYAFAGKKPDDFLKSEILSTAEGSAYKTDGQNIFIGDVEIGKKDDVLDKLNNCLKNYPGKNVHLKPIPVPYNSFNALTFDLEIPNSLTEPALYVTVRANPCPPYQPM